MVVLAELSETHPGISLRMAIAQMYKWWLGINNNIEKNVHLFREHQENQSSPHDQVASLHPLQWRSKQDSTIIVQGH